MPVRMLHPHASLYVASPCQSICCELQNSYRNWDWLLRGHTHITGWDRQTHMHCGGVCRTELLVCLWYVAWVLLALRLACSRLGHWPPSLNRMPDNPALHAFLYGNKSPPQITLTPTLTLMEPVLLVTRKKP